MTLQSLLTRIATGSRQDSPQTEESTFVSLLSPAPESVAGLRNLVKTVNAAGGTYHKLSFGPDLVFEGDYDLSRFVRHYELPAQLTGKTVLDVGTASGFWSLECARRGGSVVAIDIYAQSLLGEIIPFLSAPITYAQRSVYDLSAADGAFDLVVCGSLLLHLPDPLGALRAIRTICRDRLVVSTAASIDSGFTSRPVCDFTGQRASDGDYYTYWEFSAAALTNLLRTAGFSQVDKGRHFLLESEPGRTPYATPHVVVTARI
jgi:SAM-dependent methyltransferase